MVKDEVCVGVSQKRTRPPDDQASQNEQGNQVPSLDPRRQIHLLEAKALHRVIGIQASMQVSSVNPCGYFMVAEIASPPATNWLHKLRLSCCAETLSNPGPWNCRLRTQLRG